MGRRNHRSRGSVPRIQRPPAISTDGGSSSVKRNKTILLRRGTHGKIVSRQSVDHDNDMDVITRKLCIISHTSTFCLVWDVIIFLSMVWIAVIMPLQIAFDTDITHVDVYIDLIIDLLFWADVVVSFRTTYTDYSGDEVLDPRAIARHYAVGYFALDFISCLPGFPVSASETIRRMQTNDDSALAAWDAGFELVKLGKTSKLLRTARLVKAIRLIKIQKLSAFLEDR